MAIWQRCQHSSPPHGQTPKSNGRGDDLPGAGEGREGQKTAANSLISGGFSRQLLDYARLVLAFAPDLAPNGLAGIVSLDSAYETAKQRKREAASDEEKLAELRSRHPDLAAQVADGEKL